MAIKTLPRPRIVYQRRVHSNSWHPAVLFLLGVNIGVAITGLALVLWRAAL